MRQRALVVSNDHVGTTMVGPGIRSHRFAVELARDFDVTLVVPFETDLADEPCRDRARQPVGPGPHARARPRLRRRRRAATARCRRCGRSRAADTRPSTTSTRRVTLEQLALDAREAPSLVPRLDGAAEQPHPGSRRSRPATRSSARASSSATSGSARSRTRGRLDRARYARDPSLRTLIDVVPFGIDPEPPAPGPALRGVVPGIGADDRVLLWAGGIWNWFDPLTVIRAVHELAQRRDELRLFFLGLQHPNPGGAGDGDARWPSGVALADELGLRDRVVFFNFGWVPYAERGAILPRGRRRASRRTSTTSRRASPSAPVSSTASGPGLPVVTTRGDALGELVVARAAPGAPSTSATSRAGSTRSSVLLDDARALRRGARAAAALRPTLEWPRVARAARGASRPGSTHGAAARARPLPPEPSTRRCACESATRATALAATARASRRRVRPPPAQARPRAALGYPRPPWLRLPQPARARTATCRSACGTTSGSSASSRRWSSS